MNRLDMRADELADQLYRILKQHSDADNGPYLSERKNVGTEHDYVTIDGHLALRQFAADVLRAMEPVTLSGVEKARELLEADLCPATESTMACDVRQGCCAEWEKAHEEGTDSGCYGSMLGYDHEGWPRTGSDFRVCFCPFCGAKKGPVRR